MDYFGILKKSLLFTWKYKRLWLLGLILAIFASGDAFSSFGNIFNNDSTGVNNAEDFETQLRQFTSREDVFVIAVVMAIVFAFFVLLGWYLSSAAKAGLVKAADMESRGEAVTLGYSWKYGREKAFKFILFDLLTIPFSLLTLLPGGIVVLIMFVATTALGNNIGGAFLMCGLLLFGLGYLFAYGIIWSGIRVGSERLLVLKNYGAWEALKEGWAMFRTNLTHYVIAWFVSLLPGLVWFMISFIVGLVLAVPVVLLVLIQPGAMNQTGELSILSAAILLVLATLIGLVAALINAPYQTFSYTYWSNFIINLLKNGKNS